MARLVVLIDSRPAYLPQRHSALSLLQLPCGQSAIVSVLADQTRADSPDFFVMPTFEPNSQYAQRIRQATSRQPTIVRPEELEMALAAREPSDSVLLIDPRFWPSARLDFSEFVSRRKDRRWVLHAVSAAEDCGEATERVEFDRDGRVRRVQRYYDAVTWPRSSVVFATHAPVRALERIDFTTLPELRTRMSARGVLSRDVRGSSAAFDLTTPCGLLALNEQTLVPNEESGENGRARTSLPASCSVHSSARLVGPVILHENVFVGPEVTIVGPAVIGAGSRLGRGVLVAQSVVAPDTTLEPGVQVRHCVAAGRLSENEHYAETSVVRSGAQPPSGRERGSPSSCSWFERAFSYPNVSWFFEASMAALGLAVLSPLLLLLALLVKVTSRGPVLFGHEREGRDGQIFRCWKFRTMCDGAHDKQRELYAKNNVDGPQFKLENDPRITPLGSFLRKTNLDELPQLLNVLLGQMALIGPRPSPFRENQICVPWRRARLSVRPGITGLWQLCRSQREGGDFHQWIYFDILYVKHQSLWLDFKILVGTLLTLGGRRSVPLHWLLPVRRLESEPAPAHVPAPAPAPISG